MMTRYWQWGLVGTVVLLNFTTHYSFSVSGIGEEDSARLINDSLLWHLTGAVEPSARAFISPLVLIFLQKLPIYIFCTQVVVF